jgi:hypothetical protein
MSEFAHTSFARKRVIVSLADMRSMPGGRALDIQDEVISIVGRVLDLGKRRDALGPKRGPGSVRSSTDGRGNAHHLAENVSDLSSPMMIDGSTCDNRVARRIRRCEAHILPTRIR